MFKAFLLVFGPGHEFGHNWGSSHDDDKNLECAPKGGGYMMHPAAQDGSSLNNFKFSPCSKLGIKKVTSFSRYSDTT